MQLGAAGLMQQDGAVLFGPTIKPELSVSGPECPPVQTIKRQGPS